MSKVQRKVRSPIRKLIKKCDIEISKLVREKRFCEMATYSECGGPLQDAHVIGRRNYALRWDILNHLCLCYKHHFFVWHHDPIIAYDWFRSKFPERYSYLIAHKDILIKRYLKDYEELLDNIKNKRFDKLHFTS